MARIQNLLQLHQLFLTKLTAPHSASLCNIFTNYQKYNQKICAITKNAFHTVNSKNISSVGNSISSNIWKLGKLNHVAIAVPNLEKAVSFYKDVLCATVSAPLPLPNHGVTTVFVELWNTKLELLHPLGNNSPIEKFLLKNKAGGLHHFCLEVDDIKEAVSSVRAMGVRCLSEEPRIGAHDKPVMFLHPADCSGVLIELEQA